MHKWSYLLTLLTHLVYWPRFFLGWGTIALACILTLMTKCCVKTGKRPTGLVAWVNYVALALASMSALQNGGAWRCRKK